MVCRTAHQFAIDGLGRIVPHGQRRLLIKQAAGPREQQLQMVVELRHRAHGGAAGTHRVGLVDGNGRGHAFDLVHCRFVHPVQKLARIRREGFHIAALALGIQRVKHQTRLAGPAGPGHYGKFARTDIKVKVLEIVLTRPANADGALGHSECSLELGETF